MESSSRRPPGLHRPAHERDGCGIGFVADARGRRSAETLRLALRALSHLSHRGAVSADRLSGDGAGVPHPDPLRRCCATSWPLAASTPSPDGDLALGALFLWSEDAGAREAALEALVGQAERTGLRVFGWRPVPVDVEALGEVAAAGRPEVLHLLLARDPAWSDEHFERRLFLARRRMEAALRGVEGVRLHVASLSHRTVVYKGMMIAAQLDRFYADLADPRYETAIAVFHQRYSTNTAPAWELAQPFRLLAHNGEINTLLGNRHWMRARERDLTSQVWGEELAELLPVLDDASSDSGMLDNLFELLVRSGRDPLHAALMLVPEAFEGARDMAPEVTAFYDYHSTCSSPGTARPRWSSPTAGSPPPRSTATACARCATGSSRTAG